MAGCLPCRYRVGAIGFYLRRVLIDDAGAGGLPRSASPVPEAFRSAWRIILRVVGLNAATAVSFYFCFVYITTYLRQTDHLAASTAFDINTISMVVLLLLMPIMGALPDRCGRKPVLLAGATGLFVASWPLLWLMHHPDFSLILLGQLGIAVLLACFDGAIPAAVVEIAPDRLRCTVVSVGINLGFGVIGGFTPMIVIYTINRSHYDLSPAFLMMAAAAVSFAFILEMRETYRLALSSPGARSRTEAA